MFSPLYVGLYLFKSYTGDGEDGDDDQDGDPHATGDGEPVPVQREETGDSDIDENDDVTDGLLEESERIEDVLVKCSAATEDDTRTKTNLPMQNVNRDQGDDASDIGNEKIDPEVTNNNTNEDLPRVLEYHDGDDDVENNENDDVDEDDTGSTEFVDSQPITEEIKSARIKQNQEIFNDFIKRDEIKSDNSHDNANVSSENFAKEMFVAESKLLMQDMDLQNQSIVYEDIKQESSLEVFTACNNDIIESSAHTKKRHQNDVPRRNGIEFDLSGQSETDLTQIPNSNEQTTKSKNSDSLNHVNNASSRDSTCSTVNPVQNSDVRTLCCTDGTDNDLTSVLCSPETVDGDDIPITTPDSPDTRTWKEARVHNSCNTNGVGKTVHEDRCFAKEAFSQESACPMKEDAARSTSMTDNQIDTSVIQKMPEEQVEAVKQSLDKNDFHSDSEFSDLSDTVVADDVSSDDASDLPEDDATPSCATASLSRPTDLDLVDSGTRNSDDIANDSQPPVLSPSKVVVTCITEEETILVEEIVIPTNQFKNKPPTVLSPGTASNRVRASPFSSSECLEDFDWNEHCLRMIVTGTPETSLKMAVTGTPKSQMNRMLSPTRHGGSASSTSSGKLLYRSRDLSDINQDMREDVQTMRSEMKDKNEEISRLKNITHGLRHRLTQVEQENLKLSQSNDSFLTVRSETPSNISSCYNSVVSLSYEDTLTRSPSLEQNLLLKEEILTLKAKLETKSDTIEQLNLKTNELKDRLIEEEGTSRPTPLGNEKKKGARRKIRTVKSVNDISVEEMPRITPPSSAGSASSVFINSATLQIPTLSEQTSKKTKTKKLRRIFSFRKKKDKNK